ncbi:hypothetical protein CJ030_MR6G000790 [Morella rubra]|uniref:Uncharacterized protein n=1 Tax=Morella rubra TaxID=262757 RepID=A0A6A1V9S8_9ROSI|nr:hypothetical protein CJ030_MR6G000790 [Morella rubra]
MCFGWFRRPQVAVEEFEPRECTVGTKDMPWGLPGHAMGLSRQCHGAVKATKWAPRPCHGGCRGDVEGTPWGPRLSHGGCRGTPWGCQGPGQPVGTKGVPWGVSRHAMGVSRAPRGHQANAIGGVEARQGGCEGHPVGTKPKPWGVSRHAMGVVKGSLTSVSKKWSFLAAGKIEACHGVVKGTPWGAVEPCRGPV